MLFDIHCVSKTVQNCFLSGLCQISTNFDNFWQNDGKEAKIMRGVTHLSHFLPHLIRVTTLPC